MQISRTEFYKKFSSIVNSEYLTEVRIIKNTGGVINLFFDDIEKLYDAIVPHNGVSNIYWTINPINKEYFKPTAGGTKDEHISKRQYILIDIDTLRNKGTSATDEQLSEAKKVAEEIVKQFDRIEKVVIMSGNGYHILLKCDISNDALNTMRVRSFLEAVSRKFTNSFCRIDTNVYNASRITRIPYTINVKGNIHREATIISVKKSGKKLSSMSLDLFCGTENSKLNEPNNVRKFQKSELNEPNIVRNYSQTPNNVALTEPNIVRNDNIIPNNVRKFQKTELGNSENPNNVRLNDVVPNNVLETKVRNDSQTPNNVRTKDTNPNNVLEAEKEKTDFFDALSKCKKRLKDAYINEMSLNVRGESGRELTLGIMGELRANGLKSPHFACRWLFGKDYDADITEREWKYIEPIPMSAETVKKYFSECIKTYTVPHTKITEVLNECKKRGVILTPRDDGWFIEPEKKNDRRIETLTDLKKNITRTTFNNDRLKSVYTIYFQNGLDFDIDATDIVKLATWKSITSAAGYVIGWRGIMNDVLDLAAWIMDNSEIVEPDNPDVDETVPHVERYIYNLSYAKEKQQLRSRPIKFYEDGDILVAAATMKTIREAVNFKGSASQFYKLLFHAGLVKGRKYAANIKVWIIDSLNTHNEDKYKTQCKIIDE